MLSSRSCLVGEQGSGNLGVKGVGSLREAGEERAGSRVPKVAGTGRNKYIILCNRKITKRRETLRKGWDPGVKFTSHRCGVGSNPGPSVMWVEFVVGSHPACSEGFSPGTHWFSSLLKNQPY